MNHTVLKECDGNTTASVLDAAFEVHRQLGPGLLESVYELALMVELAESGFSAQRQVEIPVSYKGCDLGMGFRADIIVENSLLLEIKAVDEFNDVHLAQVMTYLKILGLKRGYLLTFNRRLMKEGIKHVSI
jgi:GxxExxY protein